MIRRPREYREIAKALAQELRMAVVMISREASQLITPWDGYTVRQPLPQTTSDMPVIVEVSVKPDRITVQLLTYDRIVARADFLRPL